MHAKEFLHTVLKNAIHKSRIQVLTEVIEGIVTTKTLKLSTVGRGLDLGIQERSGIRKVDRLLGNVFFQECYQEVYQALARYVLRNNQKAIILVDWTKLPNTEHYGLRAALAAEGRAITLYEEVHVSKKAGNTKVHRNFLKHLKALLPANCCPIIVTDAGFKNPWFKEVLKLGWHFVGRVRGLTKCKIQQNYEFCHTLQKFATQSPRNMGRGLLAEKNPLEVEFYVAKMKLKGRKHYNKNGRLSQDKDSKNYSRSYREPWVLVSSIKGLMAANRVVNIYKQRMTIEEGFRDLKSHQYGFSFVDNHTIKAGRLIVWLLLSALASLWVWIIGRAGEEQDLHRQFQANSLYRRRVLSFFYLGCQIVRKRMNIPIDFHTVQFEPRKI